MATATASAPASRTRLIQAKHVMFLLFGVLMVVVWLTRDRFLLDRSSPLFQRYAAIPLLMWLHGLPGAIALFLGILQFSSRLRQRYLKVHRAMGRIYVACVAISAPAAMLVALKLPNPGITPATFVQGVGWILTTATALYCVRHGMIQQHREWMMRSYPFAMVFVVVRSILAVPAVAQAGYPGLVGTVWSVIAVACFLPSAIIEWQKLAARSRTEKARATAAAR